MILSRGGIYGKRVGCSPAVEEGTGKSKEGSRTLRCRPGGVRKLEVRWPTAHAIGCGPKKDQPRTESTVGQAERPGSGETQAHHVSGGSEENRGCTTSTVGESEGSKEGGVMAT